MAQFDPSSASALLAGHAAPLAAESRVRVPAWLLSTIFHLSGLLVLGLMLKGPAPRGVVQAERTGGIVLAQTTAADEVQYFEDADDSADDRSDSAQAPDAGSVAEALPNLDSLRAASLVELPTAGGGVPAGDVLPDRLTLNPGRKVRLLPGQGDAAILAEEAGRRQRQSALGPPGHVALFGGAPAVGRRFVFVIDRSQSMGGGGLDALRMATAEFQRSLAGLRPEHEFQIVAYHHERVMFGDHRWAAATAENRRQVAPFMNNLAAFGGTNHELGLMSALYLKPDVIFLLTDGGDPPLAASQLERIRRLAGNRTTIHCLRFGYGPPRSDEHFMEVLARQNGGTYRYIDARQWRK